MRPLALPPFRWQDPPSSAGFFASLDDVLLAPAAVAGTPLSRAIGEASLACGHNALRLASQGYAKSSRQAVPLASRGQSGVVLSGGTALWEPAGYWGKPGLPVTTPRLVIIDDYSGGLATTALGTLGSTIDSTRASVVVVPGASSGTIPPTSDQDVGNMHPLLLATPPVVVSYTAHQASDSLFAYVTPVSVPSGDPAASGWGRVLVVSLFAGPADPGAGRYVAGPYWASLVAGPTLTTITSISPTDIPNFPDVRVGPNATVGPLHYASVVRTAAARAAADRATVELARPRFDRLRHVALHTGTSPVVTNNGSGVSVSPAYSAAELLDMVFAGLSDVSVGTYDGTAAGFATALASEMASFFN